MLPVNNKKGFSLVEMSVSMAIIAMLVAAVLAGNNLKHRLELNEVIDDISAISTAVKQFQAVYNNALPGDIFNAEDKFGTARTDNGNGDNKLGTTDGPGTNKNETLLFWQHLALAELIDGSYNGSSDDKSGRMQTPMKHGLYGAIKTSATSRLNISVSKAGLAGLFTPKEAYDYDTKYDDGNPTTGTLIVTDGTGETAGDCVSGSNYNLTNNGETPCILYFFIQQAVN